MNQENGQPQEQRAEDNPGDSKLPIQTTQSVQPNNTRSKGTEQGENSTTLHSISHWYRFKKWFLKVTVAEVGMLFLTVAIAASSIVYTQYAKRQWAVIRDQLPELRISSKAAKDAADTARDALVRSQRPWVGPTGEAKVLSTPVIGKDGNVSFAFEVLLKDFGTSPALNVEVFMEPSVKFSDSTGIKFVDDQCKSDAVAHGREVMFPGNELAESIGGVRYLPSLKGRPWFTLEGCVRYTDQFQERTHHTRFCFVIPYLNHFPVHGCGTTAD